MMKKGNSYRATQEMKVRYTLELPSCVLDLVQVILEYVPKPN